MILLLALLILVSGAITVARVAGSDRRLGRGRPSERDLLDAVEHDDRDGNR